MGMFLPSKPCNKCGKLPTKYYEKYRDILCKACFKDKEPSLLQIVSKWVQPEIDEMFPEPGSFSGLFIFWPPFWFSLIKLKWKKLWQKQK